MMKYHTDFLAQDDNIYEEMLDNSVIHSTIQSPEHSQIQKRFDADVGLNTDSWTLLRGRGASTRGRILVFAIDLASVHYILGKSSQLYYMLQMIYVEVRAAY